MDLLVGGWMSEGRGKIVLGGGGADFWRAVSGMRRVASWAGDDVMLHVREEQHYSFGMCFFALDNFTCVAKQQRRSFTRVHVSERREVDPTFASLLPDLRTT